MTAQVAVVALFALCAAVLLVVYARRRRWYGALGWVMLLGGQVFLALGGGELFAWGGLAGLFVSAFGALLVVMDIALQRRAPRI